MQEYESRIESLQRQVDLAQSMISSGCSTWDGGGELILSKSLLAEGKFVNLNMYCTTYCCSERGTMDSRAGENRATRSDEMAMVITWLSRI